MTDVPRDKQGKWLPGQSPNPGGAPKTPEHIKLLQRDTRWQMTEQLCVLQHLSRSELIKINQDPNTPVMRVMLSASMIQAMNGEPKPLQLIMEYVIGKAVTSVQLSGPDGEPISLKSGYENIPLDEMVKLLPSALEKLKQGKS